MQRRRIERFWDAHIHAGIALLAALVSLAPSLVEAQGPVRESSFSLTAPVRQAVDSEGPSPTYLEEPERDLGYRRAVRLYGFASALTVLAAGGVVAGAAVWDECSSSSWFCINPGPLVMFASAIVGVHGLILFAIAAGVNAKAARRDRRLQDDLQARIGLDVRVSPNEAGLVLNGSF